MKKLLVVLGLIASVALYAEGNKVEVRVGADLGTEFSHNYYDVSKDADFSYELAVEYRKELPYNFELGLGLAYQDHGKLKSLTTGGYYYNTEISGDLYDSVPLYVTAKYNFKNSSDFTPYVKANLGYSFNINDGTLTLKETDRLTGDSVSDDLSVDAKDGFYYAVSTGVEYKGFVVDLAYQVNYADVDFKDSNGYIYESSSADFSRVTLGLGYNFGF